MRRASPSRRIAWLEFDMGWSLWVTRSQFPFQIGRHPGNDLCNTSGYISRHHCALDYQNGDLLLIDQGSINGSIVQNEHIRNKSMVIEHRSCVLLSDMMFWISPCDAQGRVVEGDNQDQATELGNGSGQENERHGICLVDMCNSTEMAIKQINEVVRDLRSVILAKDRENILLLKNMGDGHLVVHDQMAPALRCAQRLLRWQASAHNTRSSDIRVAVDAGITYPSHGHDRIGLAICRAARFEKTQRTDIELPGRGLRDLRPRNRCLISRPVLESMEVAEQRRCAHVGARKLKGFSNVLHDIYQYF